MDKLNIKDKLKLTVYEALSSSGKPMHLKEIFAEVKRRAPELCDDTIIPCPYCKQKHPLWTHKTQWALQYLKHRQLVVSTSRGYWQSLELGKPPPFEPQKTKMEKLSFELKETYPKPMIFTHDGECRRYAYKSEAELENEVKKHFKEIFGKNIIRCADKSKVKTTLGTDTIPDYFALDLQNLENPTLLLIEFETAIHDLYSHISTQILRFTDILESNKHGVLQALSRQVEENLFKPLYNSIYNSKPRILIVIDSVSDVARNRCKQLGVEVIEFRTYVKDSEQGIEQEHIHQIIT